MSCKDCKYVLDTDGQISCEVCGARDDEMLPDFWSTQSSFEE
jgi:RNA polymerase subunit RPABC4/transcription elongation factor Spt4